MADEEKNVEDFEDDDEIIVAITDEEGNESYYAEEMRLTVDGDKYALLIPVGEDAEHDEDSDGDDEDDDAFFAKIVMDEDGDEAYVEPTDDEFDAVLAAYDALMEEEEE